MLKWFRKSPLWELRFFGSGKFNYAMRCNSVVKMLGYVVPFFEKKHLGAGWSIECVSLSRSKSAGLITRQSFDPSKARAGSLTLSKSLLQRIADVDAGFQVRGKEPEFFVVGDAGMMPVPMESKMRGLIHTGDIAAMMDYAGGAEKTKDINFYSIMKIVFSGGEVSKAATSCDDPVERDGCTPETAFVINAAGSAEGITIEYRVLEAMFGKENVDWKKHERRVMRTAQGRTIEKFLVGFKGKRHEVYFDISSWHSLPPNPATEQIMGGVMERQKHRRLTIELPRPPLLALFQLISSITDEQLPTAQLDRDRITEEIMSACALSGLAQDENWAGNPQRVPIEFRVYDWVRIYAFIRTLSDTSKSLPQESRSLLHEEMMEDLKAYIDGGVKSIGPG